MNLKNIKVGMIVGVNDSPRQLHSGYPRQAEVVEIVTLERTVYGRYTTAGRLVKKKRINVKLLTDPATTGRSYYRRGVDAKPKDEIVQLESRQLVGLWADMRDEVTAALNKAEARRALEAAYRARFEAIGITDGVDKSSKVHIHYRITRKSDVELLDLEINGPAVERLLELAEKGAAA